MSNASDKNVWVMWSVCLCGQRLKCNNDTQDACTQYIEFKVRLCSLCIENQAEYLMTPGITCSPCMVANAYLKLQYVMKNVIFLFLIIIHGSVSLKAHVP